MVIPSAAYFGRLYVTGFGVAAILLLVYFMGRPLYWEALANVSEWTSQTPLRKGLTTFVDPSQGLPIDGLAADVSPAEVKKEGADQTAGDPLTGNSQRLGPNPLPTLQTGQEANPLGGVGSADEGSKEGLVSVNAITQDGVDDSARNTMTSQGGEGQSDVKTSEAEEELVTNISGTGESLIDKEVAPADLEQSTPQKQEREAESSGELGSNATTVAPSDVPELPFRPIWDAPDPSQPLPDTKKFGLTKALVESRARDNVIVVSFANNAFFDFAVSWVRHLTDLGLDNVLVGALDDIILSKLYYLGVPVFGVESRLPPHDPGWGSPGFHKIVQKKLGLLRTLLDMGFEVLMSDTDVMWVRDPIPFFRHHEAADVLTSSDQVSNVARDESLEDWRIAHAAYNIGILFYRPTNASRKQLRAWEAEIMGGEEVWDQNAFNDVMRRTLGPEVEGGGGLFYAFDGELKMGILPVSVFCSGHTYFVQQLPEKFGLKPYAIHATFQYGGTAGKRHRFREAMAWAYDDDPDYFNPKDGLMSFKPNIPEELLIFGEHNVETHFALVNYQLKLIRQALAIASILNRTLIFPELWCRLDRLWYPHPGVLPGTLTSQPFRCPLDHVFEINHMLEAFPVNEFGPQIHFREYSFLSNPRVPQEAGNMPMLGEIHPLQGKIKEDSDFFNRLVQLIPARFYFAPEATDQEGWKYKKKNERDALRLAAKENSKKAKKMRFDPEHYQSTLDVQAQLAEKERAASQPSAGESGELTKAEVDGQLAGAPAEKGNEEKTVDTSVNSLCAADLNKPPVSHEELRERLHRRLAEFRAKRRADESAITARKAKEWQSKRKRESQQLGAKKGGDRGGGGSPHPSKRQKSDGGQSSDQVKIPEQLEFGRIKIADGVVDGGKPKKKKETKKDLLNKAVALKEKVEKAAGPTEAEGSDQVKIPEQLEFGRIKIADGVVDGGKPKKKKETKKDLLNKAVALKEKVEKAAGPTEAEGLRAKHEWAAALDRATGAKVLDDPKLLKKSLKREEKLKVRSSKQWSERKAQERERMEAKQRKRQDNIKARADTKKAKKIERREKKLLRPGFEGRREGFINSGD
ncbi:hypothetical protein CBR_g30748 [Chara braunii]|uniref:Nucleotide-diphospho-sugar transferase domain-containing protein n=1 Tax=Chara braunii TaxID=69332 RepID=A0A388LDJ2_CHABU|nr:hypothetical protein CBR_g30748 [Chara braunii]|eukprot:GBG80380.1 hypothetical protein CBR_g30748 [Chara braunii]